MSHISWRSLTPAQIERAELAAITLKPRWNVWVLQTLEHNGPMRITELRKALPGLQQSTVSYIISRLKSQGLVTPTSSGTIVRYGLRDAAHGLQPVHQALANWWREHVGSDGPVARAEQVERGLGRLPMPATFAICKTFAERGPLTATDVGYHLDWPLETSSFYRRVAVLRDRGLIVPTGGRSGKAEILTLTPQGSALNEVVEPLAAWQQRRTASQPSQTASPVQTAYPSAIPYQPADLFSHLPATPRPMARPLPSGRSR
ncbi:winged helix-turn-helix transcriptional regulator [Streptomyces sp. NPDC127098]|uniref:winged helix-turn-helix transcriptional regulator n=1 Tax=Streptomyces sp. NPDC127098 TaxID=3347137 RepID=UPI00366209A4